MRLRNELGMWRVTSGPSFTCSFGWAGGSEASEIKNCQNFYLLCSGMPYLRILLHSRSLYQVKIEATKERKCWNLVSEFFSLD